MLFSKLEGKFPRSQMKDNMWNIVHGAQIAGINSEVSVGFIVQDEDVLILCAGLERLPQQWELPVLEWVQMSALQWREVKGERVSQGHLQLLFYCHLMVIF